MTSKAPPPPKKVEIAEKPQKAERKPGKKGDATTVEKKNLVTPRNPSGKRWHNFRMLTPNISILGGTYAINDTHFKYRSRGRQAAPCSVVAIVYGRLFEPKLWVRDYVNQILEFGDQLFRLSVLRNHVSEDEYMKAKLIHPEFYVANYKVLTCIEETGIYGNLFSETVGCPDFADGMQKFFLSSDAGIVTAQGTSIAVWRDPEGGYLYFDPTPCDQKGARAPEGAACVMRFKCMNELRDHFLKGMDRRYDSRYCIDKVTVLRVNEVGRGYIDRIPSTGRLVVEKSVLNAINPVDIDENKLDCTKPVPKGDKTRAPTTAKIQKEPLQITISNFSIDQRFATDPLVDQNHFDTGYNYEDMHVNVPSTFRELPENMAILHGLTHEGLEMYKSKGAQNVANCVLSIAVKKIHPVKTWVRTKLDEILALGDALYAEIKAERPAMKTMTAAHLNDHHIIVEDRKLVIDVALMTVTGTISSKIPTVLNLRQALEEFFLVNKEGIIETSSMAVAIWSQDDCYYLFDPRQCDALGVRIREEKGGKGGKGGEAPKDKKKGKCCVIRFPDTDNLAAIVFKNIDQSKKNDRFTIRQLTIFDDIPGSRPWHDFQAGTPGETWILRGAISCEDESLEEESRGIQGLAMPVIALICARETPPPKWINETVDEVVRAGDSYYMWCNPPMETEEEVEKVFLVPNLKKQFYYKNRKVKFDIEEALLVGDMAAQPTSDVLNLERAIVKFFQTRQYGIVDFENLSVAIWKVEEEVKTSKDKDKEKQTVYYCFDANPRNKFGIWAGEEEEESSACVIRTLDPAVIAKIIKTNVGQDIADDPTATEFSIHDLKNVSFGLTMTDEEIEEDKKIPVKPDLQSYTNAGEDGAVLVGTINQANDFFFKRHTRDKQQSGIAFAALGMTKLYNPHLWNKEVVDDILKIGDKIAMDNLENLDVEQEEENPRNYLLPNEILGEFNIGVNRMAITLDEEVVSGKKSDLAKHLTTFFETYTNGIFRQDNVIIPIWREGNAYFALDPRGRDTRGEPREKDGAAGVMWFTSPNTLAEYIAMGAPKDDFVIDNVTLENVYETRIAEGERPKRTTSAENLWHNFPKLADGVWSITGKINMEDGRFPESNRNKQTAAIAVVANIFARVYEPRYWTPAVLDEVIITGDKLHSKCVERLGEGSVPKINEIITEFFLSSRRIDLSIKDCVEAGSLTAKPPKIQDLSTGIKNFFAKYSSGAVTVRGEMNIAMWKINNAYYVLVPNWETITDEKRSIGPRLLRFTDLTILTGYLLNILGRDGDYEITVIHVVDTNKLPPWKFDPSPAVRPSNLPPLNAYKRVHGEARAILRGSYHQGDEIFPEVIRNKQTAANCVVSLGMSVVKSPITWTKKTMDEILAVGCGVHRETVKSKPTKLRIQPKDIIRIFYVGVNILTADIESQTVTGLVAIAPPDPNEKKKKKGRGGKRKAKGGGGGGRRKKGKGAQKIRAPPPPPILLEEGLKKFFEDNRAGILVTGRGMVAIWKDFGVYFMYDPRARSDQGLPDFYGTSCAMWFACIEPFYDVIFTNIDEQEKYGRFEICRVIIKTAMIEPLPCPAGFRPYFDCSPPAIPVTTAKNAATLAVEIVTEYTFVDEELSILRGTLHLSHRTFGAKSRGYQSTAIAAVAIVVGLLHVPSTWTPELIDGILKYGDLLHSDSVRAARPGARNLSPSELLTVFIVGDFRACIHVHNHTAAGILHVFDLSEALTMFFRSNCAGILHTTNMAVAVMQHYGKFYLFDPCSRNDQARPSFDGAACLMKCENIMKMARMFVTNCNLKTPNVYTLNAVNVLSLHFFSDAKSGCPPKCEQ